MILRPEHRDRREELDRRHAPSRTTANDDGSNSKSTIASARREPRVGRGEKRSPARARTSPPFSDDAFAAVSPNRAATLVCCPSLDRERSTRHLPLGAALDETVGVVLVRLIRSECVEETISLVASTIGIAR